VHRTGAKFQLIRRTLRRTAIGAATAAASGLLVLTPLTVPAAHAAPPAPLIARQMMADDPGADLRVTMNRLTQEHVYLAGAATGAAIAGRQAEFQSAAAELDENSVALAQQIGSVYGPDAEAHFLKLWRAHIGFFAEYATAAAKGDDAGKQQARAKLDGYRMDVDALLTGANPNLPKGAVAELLNKHVEHLIGAIDAQAAGDAARAYDMLHMAAHQSQEIADPLVDAIIAQFPERFGAGAAASGPANPTSANRLTQTTVQQGQPSEGGDVSEGLSNDHPIGAEENEDVDDNQ
jgi:hypothetical protein